MSTQKNDSVHNQFQQWEYIVQSSSEKSINQASFFLSFFFIRKQPNSIGD